MLPSISICELALLASAATLAGCFRASTHIVKSYNSNAVHPSLRPGPDVCRAAKLGALVSNPEDFRAIPSYLRYEKLANYLPDGGALLEGLSSRLARFRRVTARTVGRLRSRTFANFRRCYYDLLDELKFWYLKGSNFSFYDLFTLGDNPVYLLTKLNLALFVLDFFLKGELARNFSLRGLSLFYRAEHYRILTSLFVHWDLRHLLSNLGSLLSVGNNVLKVFGPRNLLLIYFASGLAANYVSYLYNYIYKNGIPANLLLVLRSIGRNFTSATKPIVTATNTIVDDILAKSRRAGFPAFALEYLFTSATMTLDLVLARLAQLVTGVRPRSPNDVDLKVREICMAKSKAEFRSCGASSSVFGLYGALLTYYIRSGYINHYSVINNLFVSLVVPYVLRTFADRMDHVSHLVGFLAGAALSTVLE